MNRPKPDGVVCVVVRSMPDGHEENLRVFESDTDAGEYIRYKIDYDSVNAYIDQRYWINRLPYHKEKK